MRILKKHNESKGDVVLASVDQSPSSEIAEDPAATTENAESEDTITEIVDVVPEEPQLDFKIQDFVDGLQVFGFRSAGPNTRLLLGGRVFKLDDVVDNERGLIFRGSDGEYLIFEDPSGYLYKKTLWIQSPSKPSTTRLFLPAGETASQQISH